MSVMTPVSQSTATQNRGRESAAEKVGAPGVNRREFLTYAWGTALALISAEGGLATYMFMMPRFRAGEFGGMFDWGPAQSLPDVGNSPQNSPDGRYWLYHSEQGVKAIYQVCTHLGCLYKWSESTNRFECPCHGSKFTADGDYIEGPAPRSLDQFVVEIVENGQVVAQTTEGETAILPPQTTNPNAEIHIQTGKKILGKPANTSPARAITQAFAKKIT
ncbi:MAG: Rieske 2Fe-2S domain-containing protein [Chloroflexi bacterium]|nr:Rieske 2Fe-2S domain-containing protein [Chloroflexota bacterium]